MTLQAAGSRLFAKWRHGRHLESLIRNPIQSTVMYCIPEEQAYQIWNDEALGFLEEVASAEEAQEQDE